VFGKLSDEEQTEGIIIRSEEVLNVEKGQKIQKIKENNEKVSKNEVVAKVSTQNEQDIMKRIEEVNKKIESALAENQINVNSTQNITINEKIERVLANINTVNLQSKIDEYDKEIKNALYEKAKISGELTKEGSKLKSLIKEKENLENTLNSNTKNIISTNAGNISYIVDGYEEKFKTDNFEYLTEDLLKSVDIKKGSVLSVSDNKAKIIKDFNTYIVCIVNKDRLKNEELLRINRKMSLELEKKISQRTNELENTNHKLLNYINTDSLTGIGSRSYLINILDSNENLKAKYAILYMVDIIRFKNINYISGHMVADNILRTISHILRKEFCHDLVFRTDSNEFVILIKSDTCDVDKLENTAKIISDSITNIELDDKIYKISVAIGCSFCYSSYDNLLKNAEYACKMAKENYEENKNYKLYDDEISKHMLRMANIESLLKIIDYDKEFFMEFQPQFSIDGKELLGMEALIRWNSPTLGYVTPKEFIPIAENTGTIVRITKWTIEQSFKLIKLWNEKYNSNLSMSINISPKYFCMYSFINEIGNFISTIQVLPSWLDFEITEMTIIDIDSAAIDTFEKLSYLGINVSLDDFGTGYSSLNYINSFRLNRIKIAKELIDTLSYQDKKSNLVHAIIKMADSLELKTIAEGVETKEQLDILKDVGCLQIQGFYYGKPINGIEFEEKYLRSGNYSLKK